MIAQSKQKIINNFPDRDVKTVIAEIKELLINGFDDSKKTIFLCGKDKSDKTSLRYKFASFLSKEKGITLTYPEDLFEDLLEGQGKNSLLSLETQLANSVDLIVLIPESPGSFAELGAFSMDKELAKKMLVMRLGEYKSGKSFINHGPIRLVRSHGGEIYDIPKAFNENNPSHVKCVTDKIKASLPSGRKKKELDNILLYSKHILLLIFLFDKLNLLSVYKIMEKIMDRKFENKDNVACRAATHSLIRAGMINQQEGLFSITNLGYDTITNSFYMKSHLTELRTNIMNKQYYRQ
ncbi:MULTISPECIES: retron St85 family effector protein [Providencia]|uniref:retron St85 family effector protein n=1 Tax=Providencia TaxID=586 RepID=UPI0012B64EAE|nr:MULTISPECIES: retron St85 family effector protein [Providencia]